MLFDHEFQPFKKHDWVTKMPAEKNKQTTRLPLDKNYNLGGYFWTKS